MTGRGHHRHLASGAELPPVAATRKSAPASVANTITPWLFQVPPAPMPVSLHNVWLGPPAAGTIFSLPSAKKPIVRLSADQNGIRDPSVPDGHRSSGESMDRIQSCVR